MVREDKTAALFSHSLGVYGCARAEGAYQMER